MAIIIPSKNIYEINNQKVVDNEVDNIKVSAKNAVPDNHYSETVYNENILSGIYKPEISVISDIKSGLGTNVVVDPTTNPIVGIYAAYLYADSFYYIDTTIEIPIQKDTSHVITSILTGATTEGQENIKYSCSGIINSGRTNAEGLITVYTSGASIQRHSQTFLPPLGETAYTQEKSTTGTYSILKEEKERYNITTDGREYIEAEINLPNESDLGNIEPYTFIKDDKEYFALKISKLLCGVRIVRGSGYDYARPVSVGSSTLSGSIQGSTYTEYIPESVEFTIYGNTIGINLQDKTVNFGEGQHIYSFDGNELMQTTNRIQKKGYGIVVGALVGTTENISFYRYSHAEGEDDLEVGDSLYYNGEYATAISGDAETNVYLQCINGGKFASLSGLLRTTPVARIMKTPQQEMFYNNLIHEWKDGKEIATIRCCIDEYSEKKEQEVLINVIDIEPIHLGGSTIGRQIVFSCDTPISNGASLVWWGHANTQEQIIFVSYNKEDDTYSGAYVANFGDVSKNQAIRCTANEIVIISPIRKNTPMTVRIGNAIIPFVRDADGQDKPMSLYADKQTPKEFIVLGKKFIADGALSQELTIQEIPKQ